MNRVSPLHLALLRQGFVQQWKSNVFVPSDGMWRSAVEKVKLEMEK